MANNQKGRPDSGGQGGGDPKITLVFVINGEAQPVVLNPQQKLDSVRAEALRLSENLSREASEWVMRTVSGALLDPAKKVAELGLNDGDRVVLSLKTGSGG